ncbi:thioredoxin family protein [Bacteroides sp. AN502(2024)]|uniref:thioredoxin family protein n=1 Tax=Bacteroides sp. AN502(2024) TaxID=3160599 RepID=UPI003517E476
MKKFTFLCMLLVGHFTLSTAQENASGGIIFHENEPWKEMIALAQKENKLIFMDCYTSWCGPCKALSKNVFTQKKVGDFFNPQFINVKYDMEKGDGKMLQERYKSYIVGYPTLLLIDKNGKVLQQMAGYQEADHLIQGIQKAAKGRDLFTLAAEYQAGNRKLTFMKEYIESLNAAFLRDSVNNITRRQLAAIDPKELDKDEVWDVYGAYVKDVRSAAFEYLVNNAYRYYRKLNRDYYKINAQLQFCCEKELRSLFKLNFDEQGQPHALSSDTATARKVIAYMEKADLNYRDSYLAKLYIHQLLLKGEYQEAWESILLCHRMKIRSFTSAAVHDYIRFLIHYSVGKVALKDYLDVLEQFQATGEKRDFSYHMYRTMAEIYRQLGNSKKAKELQQVYQTIDEQRMKEIKDSI